VEHFGGDGEILLTIVTRAAGVTVVGGRRFRNDGGTTWEFVDSR